MRVEPVNADLLHEWLGGADGWRDPENRFSAAYGVAPGGAVLVRPDGIIAWRTPVAPADPVQAFDRMKTELLARFAA